VHKISWEISSTHTSLITFARSLALDGCFSATLVFILVHRFWIGLRSGLLSGQSRALIRFLARKVLATFDRWQGAPSCMKILVLHCHLNFFLLFCQQFNVTRAVHGCSRWQKGDPSYTMFRNLTLNHLTWWMLHCRNRGFHIESRSTWLSNLSFPNYELLQRRFIREDDFDPLCWRPILMFLGKG